MLEKGFDVRVKVSEIIENQIPEFILSESENFSEFLKQYYISQEFQGGPSDLSENLDQYLKLDNLSSDVVSNVYTLTSDVFELDDEIFVSSTVGFPPKYGLLKIDDEIITYTGITTSSFTGCVRGFSGIDSYSNNGNQKDLVFKKTEISSHQSGSEVKNLSILFLKEFLSKIKSYYTPGLENIDFVPNLNAGNFIKESKTLYTSKGTEESFRILFNVLYGVDPKVVDLEQYLIKSSSAEYVRRKVLFARLISGDPFKLVGQTLFGFNNSASAPISEVELINRDGNYLYKILLFEGYDDKSLIDGEFNITPSTRVIGETGANFSTITVDSTIGFPKSGTIISGDNIIQYNNKTVNQFFDCVGITTTIPDGQRITTNEYAYAYENGDLNSIVYFEICGVLSNLNLNVNVNLVEENDKVIVSNLGDYIKNPSEKTFKEIAFNSWIYNTNSRYQILSSNSNTSHLTKETLDKSSVKPGDSVEILLRDTDTIIAYAEVSSIADKELNLINFVNNSSYVGLSTIKVDFRRVKKYASSDSIPLKYENILANVQNTYNENDEHIYVATNSLPDYTIGADLLSKTIPSGSSIYVNNNSIVFPTSIEFITGDRVVYSASNSPISGLESGKDYFIRVTGNSIKLYLSRSFIYNDNYVSISAIDDVGSHTFTIFDQSSKKITSSKSLRKFPLIVQPDRGGNDETVSGRTVGTLINGVDIANYKSIDKVYYGPVKSKVIYNNGSNYDVVNPPLIEVSPSTGTTCLLNPVLSGSIISVLLNQKDASVKDVNSITISGGNGSGAVLSPVIENRFKEVEFNAKTGISVSNETITFLERHNFFDGQEIVYNSNGNNSIGIGTFSGSNTDQNSTLLNGGIYYAKPIDSFSIYIFDNFNNYRSGINTVGFTTTNNSGIHKFRSLLPEKVLSDVKVLSGGSGYTNRKLQVKPSGISTQYSTVNFVSHGFSDGELVTYSNNGSVISGLSTSNQYYILKIDEDKFRLANAGVAGTIRTNYIKKDYVRFLSTGTDYHIFNYPKIEVNINVSYANTTGIISATPIVRGSIEDLLIYESGSKYGAEILNYHKKPELIIKSGKNASLRPIVSNGKIIDVQVESSGSEYYSTPDVVIFGEGYGAQINVEISDGKIVGALVTKTGIGYSSSTTTIELNPPGSNFKADLLVRDLTINNQYRFSSELFNSRGPVGLSTDEFIYQVLGYADFIRSSFNDNNGTETTPQHSPIIGWAYDGNPIYGPFGYSSASSTSSVKLLSSGYSLSPSSIEDRPSSTNFPSGIFVEDYKFNNSGDLDEYNGRFAKTPDFPNGVYAYYAGIQTSQSVANAYEPTFPYFIGNYFKSKFDPNIVNLNQDFDFNNSNLLRNTFPYRTGQKYSGNDYIDFVFNDETYSSIIEGTTSGSVDSFVVDNPGDGYKIGDRLIFNDDGTFGTGVAAEVSEILGKEINKIETSVISYPQSIVTKENDNLLRIYINPYHNLSDKDYVTISGVSTYVPNLTNTHQIGVSSFSSYLLKQIPSEAVSGVVTDIYLSDIPTNVSFGSSIGIGSETLSVLNIFSKNKIVRVKRGVTGVSHTENSLVNFYPDSFTIPLSIDNIDSSLNEKIYFNPTKSIGVGTAVGVSTSVLYPLGELEIPISIPTQSIYLPNHPFKTNQLVLMGGTSSISVANSSTVPPGFNILSSGEEYFYVINKSKDYIGIVTSVGLTTTSNGLFFVSNGANNYEYYFQSLNNQVTSRVDKIQSTVSVSTNHSLTSGDVVTLNVVPNNEVGIGTSSIVRLRYNASLKKIIVDPIGFSSSSVNVNTDVITIPNHNFKTGTKVFYDSLDSIASGLSTGEYYTYRIDDNRINLTRTLYDAYSNPPSIVSIASSGGSNQFISLINPPIEVISNNDLVFDVSDSSLQGGKLKFFYDNNFINEFISIGSTQQFNTSGVGTVGITSTAKIYLRSYGDINFNLFYALEFGGEIANPDIDVDNYSKISYRNSLYNGNYNVVGVSQTSFDINLKQVPERVSYASTEVQSFSYSTKSVSSTGGIHKVKKIFGGVGYKTLPEFVGTSSSEGFGSIIKLNSSTIGKVLENRIQNNGHVYPSDKTLKPKGQLPLILNITDNQEISSVSVTYGGQNYFSPPQLVVINSQTREVNSSGLLNPIMGSGSIIGVEVVSPSKGLSLIRNEVYSINNSNGVGISSLSTSSSGIVTCVLNTPLSGFSTSSPPFSSGDEIFVEGIENISGKGFNSEDYGYSFFKVLNYYPTNPAVLEYSIGNEISSVGVAKTFQTFASITNKKNYPTFVVSQKNSLFKENEILYVNSGGGYYKTDLKVIRSKNNYIKITGNDVLSENDKILGEKSGTIASIKSTVENSGVYEVDSLYSTTNGWKDEIGSLNTFNQVTPDNDYYQNLSYSVKSPLTFDEIIDPVNRMLHTVGLKNFADVGITSSARTGIGSTSVSSLLVDFIEDIRVDTINQYDLVLDVDTLENKTKFIKFSNKKLSDFFKCDTNRVLNIDDISSRFSSRTFTQESYLDIVQYPRYTNYSRFLVQTVGVGTNEYQVDDIVVLNDDFNTYTINRGSLLNNSNQYGISEYAEISGNLDEFFNLSLRFSPKNFEDTSYLVKTFRNYYDTSTVGVGSTSIGFISLSSKSQEVSSGITTQIAGIQTSSCNGFISEVFVYDRIDKKINFFEIAVDHDGTNTYMSEYYFDSTETDGSSSTPIGSFGTSISGGILRFNFTNNSDNDVVIKSKITNFGTPSVGIQTYRFKATGQPDGSERSCRLESKHSVVSSASTIISVDAPTVTSFKSLIKIRNNQNTSLHQILFLNALTDTYILPKYYISIGNTSGIGTFGSEYDGTQAILKFYPDPSFTGSFEISSYSEILYTDLDFDNDSLELNYGTIVEDINNGRYNSINGSGNDELEFDLEYNETPIFQKIFNPSVPSVLNLSTGQFTIKNHFFSPNEELEYKEGSSFIGVGASPIGIGSTISGGTVFVGDIISGFSTITGVSTSNLLSANQLIFGPFIPSGSTIVSIGQTYQYFTGNVVSGGSTIITGISNTSILEVGSGIFSGNGTSLGTIQSIGINSITSNISISSGVGRLYYTDKLGIGLSLSNVSTGTSFRQSFSSGIVTNKCPSKVYVIKIDADNFKLTATKGSGIGITFTNYGEGNAHTLTMAKRNEKSLIAVDGIVQYPILYTSISHSLLNSINSSDTYLKLSGISSVNPGDLLKIENEYLEVVNVGLGTTVSGPISGIGTNLLANVTRGFVGSSATSHSLGKSARVYRGSYNIVGSKIFFTEAPKGTGNNDGKNNSNLPLPKSSFNGRVFLRNDYSSNIIYDEFSDSFTGIGKTYSVKYQGENVNYVEPGSGILFINQIFQTPTTENNQGNNYEIVSSGSTTNIVFSGIKNPVNNLPVTSDFDVNQNELPRGGIIISLGSTSGLGFAPLVGASVTAVVGAGGSIVAIGIGSTDILGSGYRGGPISIGISDSSHSVGFGSTAIVFANVGAGGTLSFTVSYGGTGYSQNPRVVIPEPSYQNLPVIGISRLGIGLTSETGIGLSITVDVGSVSTTGIGSTLFEVKSFDISKLGYGFKRGDVFKPVGLVTHKDLPAIIDDFELTVLDVFNDSSALWQFGELDYIDSISALQDGSRTRFPLYRNNELLSFELDENDPDSSLIEFDPLLIIFINGVLQVPSESYQFNGGTSFTFTDPPKPEDKVDIFFYRGTRDVDSFLQPVNELLKIGDTVKIKSNNNIPQTLDQESRLVFDILQSDLIETNVYFGVGIDTSNPKPISITPQKSDKIINTNLISKSRDSLSSLVFPTSRIIKNVLTSDTEIFVDDAESFNYEENDLGTSILKFDSIIVNGTDQIFADIQSNVSSSSSITLNIINGGFGYTPSSTITLSISNPPNIGIGIGTTAQATANVSAAGTVSSITITNPGFGYTIAPQVIAPLPDNKIETVKNIEFVQGFSGIVTGITTATGIGTNLALKFYLKKEFGTFETLLNTYPILIVDTNVGSGVTSINLNDSSVVGIGTTFLDNIYYIHSISRSGTNAEITCNVKSNSNIIGISTFGENIGRFSWGRISVFQRDNAKEFIVSGNVVNSGLTTYPQIQRRNYGLRDTGSYAK